MVDVSSQSNKVNITVSSSGVSSNVNASGDTSHYYSEKAREWAISERLVDGKDYSSKYYANKSNQSALNAQSFAQSAQDSYKQFQSSVDGALSDIDNSVQIAITTINTKSDETIDDINNIKTGIITDIEFVADGEKQEIQDFVDTGKDELKEIVNEIKDNAEDIVNRVGISMFDTITKDHILTYEESKGLALQGTYVYKSALAGSRYGYPDFYNKVVEEFNEATDTEEINDVTVKIHSNGHKFYDIADKTAIDSFYNSTGYAWFYGVDIKNERIFLPRNKWFALKGLSDVSVVGSGIALGITNGTYTSAMCCGNSGAIGLTLMNDGTNPAGSSLYNGDANVSYGDVANGRVGVVTDPQTSGLLAKTKDAIELDDNKYLYICVGNTTNYEGVTDVVNQGMEILEQVNQGIESRVNLEATNLSSEGKENVINLGIPDYSAGVEAQLPFTAPTVGFVMTSIQCVSSTGATSAGISVNGSRVTGAAWYSSGQGQQRPSFYVAKNDLIELDFILDTSTTITFFPVKGVN